MKGWPDKDKAVARKAAAKAKGAADAEALRLFKETRVGTADELWAMELKIREWRKKREQAGMVSYERLEKDLANWIRQGWLTLEDLRGFSEERFERIRVSSRGKGR